MPVRAVAQNLIKGDGLQNQIDATELIGRSGSRGRTTLLPCATDASSSPGIPTHVQELIDRARRENAAKRGRRWTRPIRTKRQSPSAGWSWDSEASRPRRFLNAPRSRRRTTGTSPARSCGPHWTESELNRENQGDRGSALRTGSHGPMQRARPNVTPIWKMNHEHDLRTTTAQTDDSKPPDRNHGCAGPDSRALLLGSVLGVTDDPGRA